jgi:hypothetical protein
MIPSVEELAHCLEEVRSGLSPEARAIEIGDENDFNKTIGELIESNRRFIIVDKMHKGEEAFLKRDSYSKRFDFVTYISLDLILDALNYGKSDHKVGFFLSFGKQS